MGNTILLALSNTLGLPIVIFYSALHYPIIHVSPRVCRAAIPLCIAIWCRPLLFKGSLNVITSKSDPDTKCTCGKGGKGDSIQHCKNTSIQQLFIVPAIELDMGVLSLCLCTNYSRERRKRGWNLIPIKSAQYGKGKVVLGRHTPLEYLLACQILSLLRRNKI